MTGRLGRAAADDGWRDSLLWRGRKQYLPVQCWIPITWRCTLVMTGNADLDSFFSIYDIWQLNTINKSEMYWILLFCLQHAKDIYAQSSCSYVMMYCDPALKCRNRPKLINFYHSIRNERKTKLSCTHGKLLLLF